MGQDNSDVAGDEDSGFEDFWKFCNNVDGGISNKKEVVDVTRAPSTPPLTNSPPTGPAPNVLSISSSDNANGIDLAATMDPNITRDNPAASSSGSSGIDGVEQMSGDPGPEPPVAMTAAAAIIVAKQRRGAPRVERIGVHDAGPTPYSEAPDDDEAPCKSLTTSKNEDVEYDVEDGGPSPFNSEEFKDADNTDTRIIEQEGGGENGKMPALPLDVNPSEEIENVRDVNADVESNAGRPRHQVVTLPTLPPPRSMMPNNQKSMIQLKATLVPNEPVYDGVPVREQEPPEEPTTWYRQRQARPFFAFVCVALIATVVVTWVLLSLFNPGNSSPSTSVMSLRSAIPSTPPLTTSSPSTSTSSSVLVESPSPPSSSTTSIVHQRTANKCEEWSCLSLSVPCG